MSYCVRLHERRCWGVIGMAGGIGRYRQGDRLLLLRKTARRGGWCGGGGRSVD